MQDLVTKPEPPGRLTAGIACLALALFGAFAIAKSWVDGHDPASAGKHLEQRQEASPPARAALGNGSAARVRKARLASRAAVRSGAERPAPAPVTDSAPRGADEPTLVATVAPAVESPPPASNPEPPPVPPSPAPAPAPAPAEPPQQPEPAQPEPPQPEPEQPEPAPVPPPAPSGELLHSATFDGGGGFSGWYVQAPAGRVTTTSEEPFEGSQAARFEVRDGDVEPDTGSERSEVSGPTFDEGQDIFIRDAIRLPATNTYSAPWQIIQQLHEESWSGSPGLAVFLDNVPSLKIGAGDGAPTFWRSPALAPDRWYELIYRVFLSRDPGAGFVEVWLDGVQQTLLNGEMRMYGQTIQATQTYIKVGIYRSRSTTGTSIVEHDAIAIGTSFAAVATP